MPAKSLKYQPVISTGSDELLLNLTYSGFVAEYPLIFTKESAKAELGKRKQINKIKNSTKLFYKIYESLLIAISIFLRVESFPSAGRQSTTGGVKAEPQMATRKTIKNSPTFQPFDEIKFVK